MKMINSKKVGIIGGQGWIGRSLGKAWIEKGLLSPRDLIISSRSSGNPHQEWTGVHCVKDNSELCSYADIVVLSVRPEDLEEIQVDVKGKLVISMLAMVSTREISRKVGSDRIVRAMPNAAVEIQQGYFPWYASSQVTSSDKNIVCALLSSCGMTRELFLERDLDYMTALSGSGPAYPALLAKVMIDHATNSGIDYEVALEASLQTLSGGSHLLEHLGDDPSEMVDRLISYNGTTSKGLKTMLACGIAEAISCGLSEAYQASITEEFGGIN